MALATVGAAGAGVGTVGPKTMGPAVVVGTGIDNGIRDWLGGGGKWDRCNNGRSYKGWCASGGGSSSGGKAGLANSDGTKAGLVGISKMRV